MQTELEQLRGMIGLAVTYRGMPCRVVEVLEDVPALVLENLGSHCRLQDNQFGEPRRQVPETYTIPVRTDTGELHWEFMALSIPCR